MLSALYAKCVCLSVRPSVCNTGGSAGSLIITVEVRLTHFSSYSGPIPRVLRDKFHPEIVTGFPERGVKQGRGGENKLFYSFIRQYLENGTRYVHGYYIFIMKSYSEGTRKNKKKFKKSHGGQI